MTVLRELDRRQVATRDGHRSLQEWAAGRIDVAPETARMLVIHRPAPPRPPRCRRSGDHWCDRFRPRRRGVASRGPRPRPGPARARRPGMTSTASGPLAAKRRRMTRLDEIQSFEQRYVSIQPNLDESAWSLSGRLPGFAGRTVVEALETRGDSFPYGSSVTPSRTTRNADALWSISHDAVSGGDGATVDASSPVLTVFVDATEAAAIERNHRYHTRSRTAGRSERRRSNPL